jgi:hypothetical protein
VDNAPEQNREYCWTYGKRKRRFPTESSARDALLRIRVNRDPAAQAVGVLPSTVYECAKCEGWHLASKGTKNMKDGNNKQRRRRKGSMAY